MKRTLTLLFFLIALTTGIYAQIEVVEHGNKTIYMDPNDVYEYYDSGGSSSDYSPNENSTIIFQSNLSNHIVHVEFQYVDVEYSGEYCTDLFYVSMAQLYGYSKDFNYCGREIEGKEFYSFMGGSVEFTFDSDAFNQGSGWKAIVRLVPHEYGDYCNDAVDIPINSWYQGDTYNYFSSYNKSDYEDCQTFSFDFFGKDQTFEYHNNSQVDKEIKIALRPLTVDLDLFVFDDCFSNDLTNCLGYSIEGGNSADSVVLTVNSGDNIFIVVDAYLSNIEGSFTLELIDKRAEDICNCKKPFLYEQLLCDGAETYYKNQGISEQSSSWIKWDNNSGDAEVSVIEYKDGEQSIEFISGDDNVILLGDVTEGKYRLSWDLFVDYNSEAYYNIQHKESLYHWAYHVHFFENETGELSFGGPNPTVHPFGYEQGKWIPVVQLIDLYEDRVELWIGGNFVAEWRFSIGTIGNYNPSDLLQLGGVDFFAPNGYNYFIDNICYSRNPDEIIWVCETDINPVCVNGREFDNSCYAEQNGYTECEWTEGTCPDLCSACSNCFHYWFQNGTISFEHDKCSELHDEWHEYYWEFPEEAEVEFLEGTSESSQSPICKLQPGIHEICMSYDIDFGEFEQEYTCCMLVEIPNENYCEEPPTCGVNIQHLSGLEYFLDGGESEGVSNYSWVIEYESGISMEISEPNQESFVYTCPAEGCYTICLYVTNECGYSKKCMTFCTYDEELPEHGGGYFDLSDDQVSFLDIPSGGSSYYWDVPDGVIFVEGTAENSQLPVCKLPSPGYYPICLIMKVGDHEICCCWTIYYPNQEPIEIEIQQEVCGAVGSTVLVPVYLNNFIEVSAMNIIFEIEDAQVGEFQGIQNVHAAFSGLNYIQPSPKLLQVIWDLPGDNLSVPDGTKLLDLEVKLTGSVNDVSQIYVNSAQFVSESFQVIPYTSWFGSVCVEYADYELSGKVKTFYGEGVGKADVNLEYFMNIESQTTGDDGEFSFSKAGGEDYTLHVIKDINDPNGISLEDNLRLKQHLLGTVPFTEPWSYIAANLNADDTIDLIDLTILNSVFSGNASEFQLVDSWYCLPESEYLGLPMNPLKEDIKQDLSYTPLNNDETNQDFIAIKSGDLYSSADEDELIETNYRSIEELLFETRYIEDEQRVILSVDFSDIADVAGFDFRFQWDTTYLNYSSINPILINGFDGVITSDISGGRLRTWWTTAFNFLDIADRETIFEIEFDLVDTPDITSIVLLNDPDESFILDSNFERYYFSDVSADVTMQLVPVTSLDGTPENSLIVFPNPTSEYIELSTHALPTEGTEMLIYNTSGVLVVRAIYRNERVSILTLEPGVYFLSFQMNSETHQAKFVKI